MAAVRERCNAAHERDKNENDKTGKVFLQNLLLCEVRGKQDPPRYELLNTREFLETSLRDNFADIHVTL